MPFKYELTWVAHAQRWRKRYLGQTFYMKTNVNGKTDRPGYLAALEEWQRLRDYLDGFGPNPYSTGGRLIPKERVAEFVAGRNVIGLGTPSPAMLEQPSHDPPWILATGIAAGLHPELIVKSAPTLHAEENRISVLIEKYLAQRLADAEKGNLSFKMYDEDRRVVEIFKSFLAVNYPTCVFVEQISASVLNLYRDKQTELCTSQVTLKKRLESVRKWLSWLIDRNYLKELPKDLSHYARVRIEKPRPTFFSLEEVRSIYVKSSDLMKACISLGLNAGFTQKDCSTLTAEMIDWETGILARDRNKSGVPMQAKLWPETIFQLKKVGHFDKPPLLRNTVGNPLVLETVGKNGKLTVTDSINIMFRLLKVNGKSFKHLRKTAANEIEKMNPALTSLFLAHSTVGMKAAYVGRHFEELYVLTDKLRDPYKLGEPVT